MKIKKLAALALSCAMVVSGGALFAACGDDDKKDDDKKGGFVEDTRIWYAVGGGEKGTIKDNGSWKPQNAAETLTFKRDTTKTDENVYTLTMDIYAGEGFKFVYKTSANETFASDDEVWARQVGIHNFDNVDGEGADAVIKVGEDTVFTTRDGIDANNLYLAKGQDGTYTFTLKTFPGDGAQEEVVLSVKKDAEIKIPYDMYVYGDMNDFGWKDKLDYAMTSSSGVWTMFLTVTEDDLTRDATGAKVKEGKEYAAVQLVNEGEGAAAGDAKKFAAEAGEGVLKVTDATQGEVNLLPAGEWKITFTEEGKVASIRESSYVFLIGSFNDWKEADGDYGMTEQDDGSWAAVLTVDKDEELKSFNAHLTGNKYSNGDNVKLTAGTWAVKYDPETNTIQVEEFGYWVVGTFDGANFAVKEGVTPKLEATETEGVYTCEYEITVDAKTTDEVYGWLSGSVFALKAVYGTDLLGAKDWIGPVGDANGNVMINSLGTYVVTVTVTEEGATVAAKKAGAEEEATHDMYLIGAFNEWKTADADYKMTEAGDFWTATITLAEEAKLNTYNTLGATDSVKYSASGDVTLAAGKWAVKYNPATNTFQTEKFEYYAVGTFAGTDFNIKKDVTPKLVAGADANVVTCTLDVVSALSGFGWVAEQGPAGSLFAIQVVYGTELLGKGAQEWVGGGNTFITAEGEHTISFTVDTHQTTVTKN